MISDAVSVTHMSALNVPCVRSTAKYGNDDKQELRIEGLNMEYTRF